MAAASKALTECTPEKQLKTLLSPLRRSPRLATGSLSSAEVGAQNNLYNHLLLRF